MKEPFWLVNEHIAYVFSFSAAEMEYIEKRSFSFDVGLLLRTVPAVLRRRGV